MTLIGNRRAVLLGGGESAAARAERYGLVSYWNANEASGTLIDAYGANTLADNNTVTSVAGKVLTARQYTRANSEYHSIANNASLNVSGLTAFWWAFWFFIDGNQGTIRYIQSKLNGGVSEGSRISVSGANRLAFFCSNGGTNATATATTFGDLSTGTWYFGFAYHTPGVEIGVSVNAGAFNTAAFTVGIDAGATARLLLGAGESSSVAQNFWDGALDAIAFGKSPPAGMAAVKAEIPARLYSSGVGREWPNL